MAQQHQQQQDGRSSGPGNWLKGSFLRHILLSAGLAQDRQEDKQTIRKVLIRRLSFSHFPTVSDLETPDQGKLRSIRAQCRSIYQDDEACLAIGVVDICTVLFTPQRRQLKHRAKRSSRSNAFVVIGSNIEMLSWKNICKDVEAGCWVVHMGRTIMEILF